MMPSVIYAYIQIGHFLMLIMSTSWVYSTFFFLALCSVLGPQGHMGNILLCWKKPSNRVEAVNESRDSASAMEVFSVYSNNNKAAN